MEKSLKKIVLWGKVAVGIFLAGVAFLAWYTKPIHQIKTDIAIFKTEIQRNTKDIAEGKTTDKELAQKIYELKKN